ncbi:hypothetical protein BH10BAC6_BH10BAC6_10110 [soil metagenome]
MLEVYDDVRLGPWSRHHAAHLLRRMTVGPTPFEISRAVEEGREATVERILTPWTVPTEKVSSMISDIVLAELQPIDTLEYYNFFVRKDRRYIELVQWWASVIVRSPLSAQERMTLWWHMCLPSSLNGAHFAENIFDQNMSMRRHGLGSIPTLVDEVIHGMAMQIYLSGTENVWQPTNEGVNENLAREMMEIFLLGRTDAQGLPSYSQEDVSEIARSLSGWRIAEVHVAGSTGTDYLYRMRELVFSVDHWDPRPKTVFGQTGTFRSKEILDLLFTEKRSAIARHICSRWYSSFINETVEEQAIEGMTELLLDVNMDMTSWLRVVLNSSHFFESRHRMRIATPPMVSFLAQLRYADVGYVPDFDDYDNGVQDDLYSRLRSINQCMYYPPNVSGWPDTTDYVAGTEIAWRLEMHMRLWSGTMTFKNYNGGRQVYPIVINSFLKSYGMPATIRQLAEMVLCDLAGIEADAKDLARRLCPVDRPCDNTSVRGLMKTITTSPRILFH